MDRNNLLPPHGCTGLCLYCCRDCKACCAYMEGCLCAYWWSKPCSCQWAGLACKLVPAWAAGVAVGLCMFGAWESCWVMEQLSPWGAGTGARP